MMSGFIKSFFEKNRVAFLTCLIFGCACGAVFRFDMEWWDFANYHYYNAWAFLNGRLDVDSVPAFINTFFSPFIELPSYFLTNALNNNPVLFSTVMAVPYGLLLFAAYKITTLFFPAGTKQERIRTGLTLLLCVCSVPVFMELSGTTHEHPMSFLVLTALYLLLKKIPSRLIDTKTCLISGFILGVAAGLKMTYCLYAAATGLSLILFSKHIDRPVKSIVLFTLAGTAGFSVSYGYWGWILWKNFKNPFFPFLNGLFQSPYWNLPEYRDVRYFDLPWLNVIFYPLHQFLYVGGDFSMHHRFILSHLRIVVGMIPFAAFLYDFIKECLTRKKKNPADDNVLMRFLMLWMMIAYVFWLGIFRVYRYMIPFELMLSIVLVHFLFRKENFSLRSFSFTVRLFPVLLFSVFVGNECMHLAYSRSIDKPLLPATVQPVKNDTLLLLDFVPGSVFIPFLAPNPTVRAVLSPRITYSVNGSTFHTSGHFAKKRDELIAEHKRQGKPIAYIVGRPFYSPRERLDEICTHLGVLSGSDYYIRYFLCPD